MVPAGDAVRVPVARAESPVLVQGRRVRGGRKPCAGGHDRAARIESASRPVSRVLYGLRPKTKTWQPFLWDTRCRAPQATYPDDHPGKRAGLAPGVIPIRSCSRWGLPCRFRCRSRGGLLPHPFTLTPPPRLRPDLRSGAGDQVAGRFAFCGTFPGVAPAGRYPAPFIRGARTFLALLSFDGARRGCPADWRALLRPPHGR